jgi:hypothetical protein
MKQMKSARILAENHIITNPALRQKFFPMVERFQTFAVKLSLTEPLTSAMN